MELRFVSWNIHSRSHMDSLLDLLQTVDGNLVALQEVTQHAYDELVASQVFGWSAYSLNLRPPQPGEGRGRTLGCAIFGRAPFSLSRYYLLEDAPLPESTCGGGRLSSRAAHYMQFSRAAGSKLERTKTTVICNPGSMACEPSETYPGRYGRQYTQNRSSGHQAK